MDDLRELIPLAPLHQPHNLAAIEAVTERLPDVPQVACFDTAFHRGQPAVAELVPLPRELCRAGVQRYGFHGLSYEYIASVLPEVAPEIAERRVIVAHLGSGASLCAMRERKSIDSSSGSPRSTGCAWAPGPARSIRGGALPVPGSRTLRQGGRGDPVQEVGAPRHLRDQQRHAGACSRAASPARASPSTTSSTARRRRSARSPRLSAGSTHWCSAPASARHSAEIRRRICEASRWLGVELDPDANARRGPRISRARRSDIKKKLHLGLGDPDQRGADDRPPYECAAGARRGPRMTRGYPSLTHARGSCSAVAARWIACSRVGTGSGGETHLRSPAPRSTRSEPSPRDSRSRLRGTSRRSGPGRAGFRAGSQAMVQRESGRRVERGGVSARLPRDLRGDLVRP